MPEGNINDNKIPAWLLQGRQYLFSFGKINRGYALRVLGPNVSSIKVVYGSAADNLENLSEAIFHFSTPLVRQVGRNDYQNPLNQSTQLEFFE